MGILIIFLFVLIIVSMIVLLYPRRLALRIGGINRYDLQSVPQKYVIWVFAVTSIILTAAIVVLIFILKDQLYPVPAFLQTVLEWLNV